MFAILRVCVQCQKSNLKNVGKIVYGTARPYTFGGRSRNYQMGTYLKPLLFTATVCIRQPRVQWRLHP